MLRRLSGESSLAVAFDLKSVDPVGNEAGAVPVSVHDGLPRSEIDRRPGGGAAAAFAGRRLPVHQQLLRLQRLRPGRAALAARLFPDQKLAAIPADDPLFKSMHTITKGKDRQTNEERPIELEGVRIKNRLVLVYSKNDMVTQLKQVSDPFGNGYDADTCRKLAVNIVAYALQN